MLYSYSVSSIALCRTRLTPPVTSRHPQDTVFGEVSWPSGELFSSDHYEDAMPLSALVNKCYVTFRPPGAEAVDAAPPPRASARGPYLCRFHYDPQTLTLRPTTPLVAPTS
jgi:hypothetical protein